MIIIIFLRLFLFGGLPPWYYIYCINLGFGCHYFLCIANSFKLKINNNNKARNRRMFAQIMKSDLQWSFTTKVKLYLNFKFNVLLTIVFCNFLSLFFILLLIDANIVLLFVSCVCKHNSTLTQTVTHWWMKAK